MSNIDKRALREAAEKATPGRIGDRVDGSIKYTCRGTDGTLVLSTDNHDDYGFVGDNSLEDELFFRLCDPVTVLALLDELEAKDRMEAELLNIISRHTIELGWGEKPITLAELIISREGTGSDALDAIRAAAAGKGELA